MVVAKVVDKCLAVVAVAWILFEDGIGCNS